MRRTFLLLLFTLSAYSFATVAEADDWVAQKLRGTVYIWVNDKWARVQRGDTVSNSAPVRTMSDGQVEFIRDRETITIGPNTQIQILDRIGRRYTTVNEAFGSVRVEANVENVQHFSVETPYVAATVKGTIFTVISGAHASEVRVQRGRVSTNDLVHGLHVDVLRGQSAIAGRDSALHLAGPGKLNKVTTAAGQTLSDFNISIRRHNQIKAVNVGKADDDGDGKVNVNGDDKAEGNRSGNAHANGDDNADSGGDSQGHGKSGGDSKGHGNGGD